MASAVDSRLAYARLSAVATASRLPTANRGSNNSYTTSWDTTEIRKRRVHHRSYSNWRWHLDEVFVRINGETHYLWRAVDHEGEVLEVFVTKRRDRKAALKFLRKTMKRYGRPEVIVTDRLRSYRAAMNVIGNAERQATDVGSIIGLKIRINRSGDESERWRASGVRNRFRNSPRSTLQFTTFQPNASSLQPRIL